MGGSSKQSTYCRSLLLILLRTFIEHVLRPLLGFADWWDRFEWQARGSGHLHALFWIPGAPPLNVETEEARTTFAQYWGAIITALNPDPLRLPDARNPASLEVESAPESQSPGNQLLPSVLERSTFRGLL